DAAEMLIHAVGHVIEALADLAPKVGELAPKLAEAPVHVVPKRFQRAVGGIRATLEHRRPRWHVGGFVDHRARAYRSWRRAAMPCRVFMVAHDLATRLSAQLGLREGAARPDSERPVRFDHLSPGGRQLHEADRVRVDREQLLAHRARLKAAHDGSDTMVPAGSTD